MQGKAIKVAPGKIPELLQPVRMGSQSGICLLYTSYQVTEILYQARLDEAAKGENDMHKDHTAQAKPKKVNVEKAWTSRDHTEAEVNVQLQRRKTDEESWQMFVRLTGCLLDTSRCV